MNVFLKKNKNKKVVILDIPLLLENRINKKSDILVFVQSKKLDILKRLKKTMIDSHCHLDHESLLSDLSNIIKRSKEVGIHVTGGA